VTPADVDAHATRSHQAMVSTRANWRTGFTVPLLVRRQRSDRGCRAPSRHRWRWYQAHRRTLQEQARRAQAALGLHERLELGLILPASRWSRCTRRSSGCAWCCAPSRTSRGVTLLSRCYDRSALRFHRRHRPLDDVAVAGRTGTRPPSVSYQVAVGAALQDRRGHHVTAVAGDGLDLSQSGSPRASRCARRSWPRRPRSRPDPGGVDLESVGLLGGQVVRGRCRRDGHGWPRPRRRCCTVHRAVSFVRTPGRAKAATLGWRVRGHRRARGRRGRGIRDRFSRGPARAKRAGRRGGPRTASSLRGEDPGELVVEDSDENSERTSHDGGIAVGGEGVGPNSTRAISVRSLIARPSALPPNGSSGTDRERHATQRTRLGESQHLITERRRSDVGHRPQATAIGARNSDGTPIGIEYRSDDSP